MKIIFDLQIDRVEVMRGDEKIGCMFWEKPRIGFYDANTVLTLAELKACVRELQNAVRKHAIERQRKLNEF